MDLAAIRGLDGVGWTPGPAECAMAAYFASRKQIRLRLLHSCSVLLTQLSPQGAGRIQSLRAFRRARLRPKNILFWSFSGYVAAMATLVMSFRIERTSRDVIW